METLEFPTQKASRNEHLDVHENDRGHLEFIHPETQSSKGLQVQC